MLNTSLKHPQKSDKLIYLNQGEQVQVQRYNSVVSLG